MCSPRSTGDRGSPVMRAEAVMGQMRIGGSMEGLSALCRVTSSLYSSTAGPAHCGLKVRRATAEFGGKPTRGRGWYSWYASPSTCKLLTKVTRLVNQVKLKLGTYVCHKVQLKEQESKPTDVHRTALMKHCVQNV